MYRGKRKFNAVLVLVCAAVGVALMLSGCPDTGPTDGPGGNPNPGTSMPDEFDVGIADPLPATNEGEYTVEPRKAKSGDTITITMKPEPGYSPRKPGAYESPGNHPITVTPGAVTAAGYTYTFKMPSTLVYPALVRVSLKFDSVIEALTAANLGISQTSSWDDIDALNELIKKAQNLNVTGADKGVVDNAIEKLYGKRTDNSNTLENLGIIESKIRIEDLYEQEWISPNTKPPSYPHDKAQAPAASNTGGSYRTNLYYVEEDNPNPTIVAKKGWEAGSWVSPSTAEADAKEYGIREIPLTYTVGTGTDKIVKYRIWLYPCAQYTLVYDQSEVSGDIKLNQYEWSTSTDPRTTDGTPFGGSKEQTLNSGTRQKTGDVGKVTDPNTNATVRGMYMKVATEATNISIRVTFSDGTNVTGLDGTPLTNITSTTKNPDDFLANRFYPESRHYVLHVNPRTPPTTGLP